MTSWPLDEKKRFFLWRTILKNAQEICAEMGYLRPLIPGSDACLGTTAVQRHIMKLAG